MSNALWSLLPRPAQDIYDICPITIDKCAHEYSIRRVEKRQMLLFSSSQKSASWSPTIRPFPPCGTRNHHMSNLRGTHRRKSLLAETHGPVLNAQGDTGAVGPSTPLGRSILGKSAPIETGPRLDDLHVGLLSATPWWVSGARGRPQGVGSSAV